MAKLKINGIKPSGAELFNDSESFMNELSNDELEQTIGGIFPPLIPTVIPTVLLTTGDLYFIKNPTSLVIL